MGQAIGQEQEPGPDFMLKEKYLLLVTGFHLVSQ